MVNQGLLDAEGARIHPESNIITQSLGDLYGSPRPDSKIYPIFKNDIILACSDGLNSMLSDADIAELINKYSNELDVLADKLIENANLKGGKDNITVILVKLLMAKFIIKFS
ncbi:MAG: hypothetical protein IPJ13_17840 [Saprospiraceae bacterium]|nr:hypothetical protein [Saprospiraceae bacterium]